MSAPSCNLAGYTPPTRRTARCVSIADPMSALSSSLCARLGLRRRLYRRDHELGPGPDGAEIEIRVVLTQQPDRNVVALLREHPDRFARLDHMRLIAADAEFREERFLQLLVILLATPF